MRSLTVLALLSLAACGEYDRSSDGPWSTGSATTGAMWSDIVPDEPEEPEPEEAVCDQETPITLYVSPDDSNSMSSPVQVREAVLSGAFVPHVRPWEFFNYASWDYPAAAPGTLDLDLQLAALDEEGHYALQVGIVSEHIAPEERDPMVLTFSVDQSGSMSGTPIRMVRTALEVIAAQLRVGDVVSIVGWSESQDVLIEGHVVSGPNDPAFLSAIRRIGTSGGTDLAGGLRAAYGIAEAHQAPGVINRVVLMSDGGANLGITDEEFIGEKAGNVDEQGIYLIGVGTGSEQTYNDLLMDRVTDLGRGAAVFIPTKAEAQRIFGDRFLEAMATTARDVQIRYDLPPGFEIVRFSGEQISTDPEAVQPQHMAPNDAVVLHQTLTSCALPVDLDQVLTVTVTYLDGVDFAPGEVSVSRTLGELLDGENRQLLKGAALLAYTDALTAEDVDRPEAARHALRAVDAAEEALGSDRDLVEVREVLEALQR